MDKAQEQWLNAEVLLLLRLPPSEDSTVASIQCERSRVIVMADSAKMEEEEENFISQQPRRRSDSRRQHDEQLPPPPPAALSGRGEEKE